MILIAFPQARPEGHWQKYFLLSLFLKFNIQYTNRWVNFPCLIHVVKHLIMKIFDDCFPRDLDRQIYRVGWISFFCLTNTERYSHNFYNFRNIQQSTCHSAVDNQKNGFVLFPIFWKYVYGRLNFTIKWICTKVVFFSCLILAAV